MRALIADPDRGAGAPRSRPSSLTPRLRGRPIVYVNRRSSSDGREARGARPQLPLPQGPATRRRSTRCAGVRDDAPGDRRSSLRDRRDGSTFFNEVAHLAGARRARQVVRFAACRSTCSAASRARRLLTARAGGARSPSGAPRSSPRPARCWTRRSTCARRWTRSTRLSVPFLGDVCIVDEIHLNDVRRLRRGRRRPARSSGSCRELPSALPGRRRRPDRPRGRVAGARRSSPARARRLRPAAARRPAAGRLRPRRDARAARRPAGAIIGIVVFASLDPARRYGTERPAAGRGPRPPRRARARQRAALRGPRRRRARAAGGAAPAAAAGARRRRARRALPPRRRRQPDRRRLLRRAAAARAASTS